MFGAKLRHVRPLLLVAAMAIFAAGEPNAASEPVGSSELRARKPNANPKSYVTMTVHNFHNPGEDGGVEPYIMGQWEFADMGDEYAHFWMSGYNYTDRDGTHRFPWSGWVDGPPTASKITTENYQLDDKLILLEADEMNADDILGRFTVQLGTYQVTGSDGSAEVIVTLLNDTEVA